MKAGQSSSCVVSLDPAQPGFYRTLLQECAALHGETVADKRGIFHVDGVRFDLMYFPEVAPDDLQLWAEVLTVEPGKQSIIYRQVLSGNLHLQTHGFPVLSLCPETSKVQALLRLPLQETTPASLQTTMKTVAPFVSEWRDSLPQNTFSAVTPPLLATGDQAGGKFHSLIVQYCKLAGIDRPALLVEGHPFNVDGVTFSLCYNATNGTDYFSVYCDFGKVLNSQTAFVQAALLKMNTMMYMTHGMCLTLSPTQKDHAVCTFRLGLAGMSGSDFLATLEAVASMAEQWRTQLPAHLKTFSDSKPANQGARWERLFVKSP